MIVSTDNVTVRLSEEDIQQFSSIIADDRPDAVSAAATKALRHIVALTSGKCPACPVMLDAHVFMANKVQEDPGAAVD